MTQFDSRDLHREVIKRFSENLGSFVDVFGGLLQLSIEISQGRISHGRALISHNWYQSGDSCYHDLLVINVPSKKDAYILLLNSDRLINSGIGLISEFRIQWSDGNFGFNYLLPHRGEIYD